MTKNPLINALLASLYITLVATFMYYAPELYGPREETILIPITLLSLFVLSAAMMGYLFLYEPAQLFLDNRKTEAVQLFLKTAGSFALITLLLAMSLFLLPLQF